MSQPDGGERDQRAVERVADGRLGERGAGHPPQCDTRAISAQAEELAARRFGQQRAARERHAEHGQADDDPQRLEVEQHHRAGAGEQPQRQPHRPAQPAAERDAEARPPPAPRPTTASRIVSRPPWSSRPWPFASARTRTARGTPAPCSGQQHHRAEAVAARDRRRGERRQRRRRAHLAQHRVIEDEHVRREVLDAERDSAGAMITAAMMKRRGDGTARPRISTATAAKIAVSASEPPAASTISAAASARGR